LDQRLSRRGRTYDRERLAATVFGRCVSVSEGKTGLMWVSVGFIRLIAGNSSVTGLEVAEMGP
jgi:hypothetical protein